MRLPKGVIFDQTALDSRPSMISAKRIAAHTFEDYQQGPTVHSEHESGGVTQQPCHFAAAVHAAVGAVAA